MPQQFTNNARALLTASIGAADTSMVVESNKAYLFPVANTGTGSVPAATDWFKVTLQNSAGDVEIVYVRSRPSGSSVFSNIIRGQEGTTALAFSAGTVVGLRITAADIQSAQNTVGSTGPTGSLVTPAGTEAERDVSPQPGYFRYNTDTGSLESYNGTVWVGVTIETAQTGALATPAGTTAERGGSPQAGYFRFNTDTDSWEGYDGVVWKAVGGGATGGGADEVFVENSQFVTVDYTIPSSRNAMSTGPVTVNSGIAVTVSDGSRWVVL